MNDTLFYSKFIYRHYDYDYNHNFYNTFNYRTEEELINFKEKLQRDRKEEKTQREKKNTGTKLINRFKD